MDLYRRQLLLPPLVRALHRGGLLVGTYHPIRLLKLSPQFAGQALWLLALRFFRRHGLGGVRTGSLTCNHGLVDSDAGRRHCQFEVVRRLLWRRQHLRCMCPLRLLALHRINRHIGAVREASTMHGLADEQRRFAVVYDAGSVLLPRALWPEARVADEVMLREEPG